MKLITETVEQDIEILIENTDKGKKYFVEGRWATADEKNKNGRVYPKRILEAALNVYDKEYIKTNKAVGELNHPNTPQINYERVSHIIENLSMNGNYVEGRARIVDLPMGIIVQKILDEGIKPGVSTRGLGTVSNSGAVKMVNSDYVIKAIDIVSEPSGPGCWVNGILEGVDYKILEDGSVQEMAVEMIVESHKKKIDEAILIREFVNFITKTVNSRL